MCLKWDFFGIEWNCATICKQLQIRIISENIFSLILMVYRHRKLGSPNGVTTDRRASPEPPIIDRTSITEKRQIFPSCTLLIYGFDSIYKIQECFQTISGSFDLCSSVCGLYHLNSV